MRSSDHYWRGVPLTELYGSQSPWDAPEFPPVTPDENHTVLYHVPAGGLAVDRPPRPHISQEKWDTEHVKLPSSSHSLCPMSNNANLMVRRWDVIEASLSGSMRSSMDITSAILSYNPKFATTWTFQTLHTYLHEYLSIEESQYFFDVTLPEIAKLALELPRLIRSPIPLLTQNDNLSLSLSQQQIACLLANAFFCTFPRRYTRKKNTEYSFFNYINFHRLYENIPTPEIMEKLRCLCHYFRRVTTTVSPGVVTFARSWVPPRRLPDWPRSAVPLATMPLHVDSRNSIEDADGLIQVDASNRYIGGEVLRQGCYQEDIRFVIYPELLICMLFTELLRANEKYIIIGAERYSNYSGYGPTFQWRGDFQDNTPSDSSQRRRCAVVAIDTLAISSLQPMGSRGFLTRELNKSWISFRSEDNFQLAPMNYPGVATGNRSSIGFPGCSHLKSLVQMMACAQAGRPMAYYTFTSTPFSDDIIRLYNMLVRHNITVGRLFRYIYRFARSNTDFSRLYRYLHEVIEGGERLPRNRAPAQQHLYEGGERLRQNRAPAEQPEFEGVERPRQNRAPAEQPEFEGGERPLQNRAPAEQPELEGGERPLQNRAPAEEPELEGGERPLQNRAPAEEPDFEGGERPRQNRAPAEQPECEGGEKPRQNRAPAEQPELEGGERPLQNRALAEEPGFEVGERPRQNRDPAEQPEFEGGERPRQNRASAEQPEFEDGERPRQNMAPAEQPEFPRAALEPMQPDPFLLGIHDEETLDLSAEIQQYAKNN